VATSSLLYCSASSSSDISSIKFFCNRLRLDGSSSATLAGAGYFFVFGLDALD